MPTILDAADPATPLLQGRIQAVFRQLPRALNGDEEAIHQMRVAGRRLRVALPLLAQKPTGNRVRRTQGRLRELTRAAGGSRDLDVILALFEERSRGPEGRGPELGTLHRRLKAARARSHKRMVESLLDLDIAHLRRDLRRILARRGEGLFSVLLRLKQKKEDEGAAILSALAAVGDRFDPDALHRIRMRCRRLRYAAEVGDALKDQRSGAPELFKELQEGLGHIHDTFVLAGWLARQTVASEARGAVALAAAAREQQQSFLEETRAHHRALLELRPADLVQRAMDAMGGARSAA